MRLLAIKPKDMRELSRTVKSVYFLSHLTVGSVERICRALKLFEFSPKEMIIKEGNMGDCFYMIRRGTVQVVTGKTFLKSGNRIASLKKGDFFGEIALIANCPRTASVVCHTTVQVFALESKAFAFLCENNPDFENALSLIAEERQATGTL